ncbi:MAG TPA: HEAT repeat domain-containing protein [Gemmatimonadales bacterium]|nr:HEAT repeat domain-containing protein [Gemmatimonadales bacterium]
MSHRPILLLLTGLACAPAAGAQSITSRIGSQRDGYVGIAYAARADVCGHGTDYIRIGTGTFLSGGGWVTTDGDGNDSRDCERGPVRVLITRAEGRTVGLKVGVAGGPWPAGTTDLGTVGASLAAEYFLGMAAETDGRLGREALLPAVLADSAAAWRGLIRIALDRKLSRGLRESATGWLGREASWQGADVSKDITTSLTAIAGNREEPASLRSRAVSSLGRNQVTGTAALVRLADSEDPVVSRAAMRSLGRSSDPRAREVLRTKVRDGALPEGTRHEAIRSLGGSDAMPSDYALLREIWPTLPDGSSREAVLESLAEAGGADNVRWLLQQAGSATLPASDRARAVRAAGRAGANTDELSKLYDAGQDRRVKEALLDALIRIGDRASIDKVTSIAQSETDVQIRRAAINRLAKLGDEKANAVLKDMVER